MELVRQGAAEYELGDCARATEHWEAAYKLAPDDLLVQKYLAEGHLCQYRNGGELQQLRLAESFSRSYLERLDPSDVETRMVVEAQLTALADERARAEAKIAARERALNAAEEAARREEAARLVRLAADSTPEQLAARRERQRALNISGGVLIGLGAASLAVMAGGLALGVQANREAEEAGLSDPMSPDDGVDAAAIARKGVTGDRMAWSGGVIGGVLILGGVTALIVAAAEQKRYAARARLRPRLNGVVLRF